jgi:soluble lytic murein transglycosylase-like protein
MSLSRRRLVLVAAAAALAGCGRRSAGPSVSQGDLYPGETPEMRALIRKYAGVHGIPESLLHRVIQRESDYNPAARNGPYYGLMQILPQTARTMGYRGAPEGLLDAETNLIYAGKYLRGAWLVSGGSQDRAVMWYAKGYYYEAKRMGLLEETGLRT